MVNIRKLKQAMEDHKYNVENLEIVAIQDSYERLDKELEGVLEYLEFITEGIKVG